MARKEELSRDIIVQTLVKALEPLEYAHAFWEGGAAAYDRIDEWSDIDLYLVVDDERVDEAFVIVERALESLSRIERKLEVSHPSMLGLSQAFYKLEGASEYLLIDLAILKLSSPEKFLEPEIHGKAVFYFNKSDRVRCHPLDRESMVKKVQGRLDRLKAKLNMFNSFIEKEIHRGNYLEALELYRNLTLATLVETMRIKYNPFHHDFKTRYLRYELPPNIMRELKRLYFVKDEKDLRGKYVDATRRFHETASEISKEQIKLALRARRAQ